MGKKLRRGFYWRGGVIWVRTDPIDRLPRSTGRRDAAAAYLWEAERQRVSASPGYAASLAASFGDWVVRTIDIKTREKSAGTVNMYQTKLGHFVRIWGEECRLASVSAPGVDAYIKQRQGEGAKNNTIRRELTCLRQLLRFAKRAGQYPADIAEVMPVGFSANYTPTTRTLKVADLPALLAALPSDTERAWVCLAIAVGADAGDIERATKADYDPVRKVMRVRGTKTVSRDAEVPILEHVETLFLYALERLPVSWPRASKALGEACARAGIPHLSPKDLRRTASSWLIAAGANQSHVSRFLRHKNDAMVRMVYGQVTPEELGSLLGDSAKTLQNIAGPLAKQANAEDLKVSAREPVRESAAVLDTYRSETGPIGSDRGATSLQPDGPSGSAPTQPPAGANGPTGPWVAA
jgi:site-specific recombinase XerD